MHLSVPGCHEHVLKYLYIGTYCWSGRAGVRTYRGTYRILVDLTWATSTNGPSKDLQQTDFPWLIDGNMG